DWQTVNVHGVAPQPEAAAALQAAQAKKIQVVYLALGPDRATTYRKLRDWIELKSSPEEKLFPAGPVLGRPAYGPGTTVAEARRQLLAELKERFAGKLTAVAGTIETAEAFRGAGATVLLLSDAAGATPGVVRLAAWKELADHLP